MGEHGQLTQATNFRNNKTKYKRSNNVFAVASIALTVVHICTELLQLPVQSLIGAPGTLEAASPLSHQVTESGP